MKKKLFFKLILLLSSSSFSFYRMKGIYNHADYPKVVPFRALQNDPELTTVFLYNKNTHLRLEYTFRKREDDININIYPSYRYQYQILDAIKCSGPMLENIITPEKFLTCEFKYNSDFWNNFLHICELHDFFESNNNFIRFMHNNYYSLAKQKLYSNKREFASTINMRPIFRSNSGIKIDNTGDEVIITRGKENITLKKALKKYFQESDIYTRFASTYAKYQNFVSNSSSSKENYKYFIKYVEPLLSRLNNPILSDESFNLLNKSKILAVWCLVPNKLGKESQIIGLAEDKKGKLFHWATDLKNDISMLFPKIETQGNYYIKQVKNLMSWSGKQAWWVFEKLKRIGT